VLVKNPSWIAYNQQNIVNCHQDFAAIPHIDIFQGQSNIGLFYCPNHSGETKQKEDVGSSHPFQKLNR